MILPGEKMSSYMQLFLQRAGTGVEGQNFVIESPDF